MEPVWTPGATPPQKLARINTVLERFWNEGKWEGLFADITPTSSGGVITLASGYKNIDALQVSTAGSEQNVPIKSQLWKFTPSAEFIGDWTKFGGAIMAFDKGETSGTRLYQIAGPTATVDAYTYTAQAKKRYIWATSASDIVIPDCFPALLLGVRAYHWLDQGDNTRFQLEFSDSLRQLGQDTGGVQEMEGLGSVSLEYTRSGGAIPCLL